MITNKQKDPDNHNYMMSIAPNVAILARDASDENGRIVTITLASYKIQLVQLDNRLQVIFEGGKLQNNNYQHRVNGKTIFEISTLPDGSVQVSSNVYEITVVYNGENVQIWVSKNMKPTNIKTITVS